METGRAKTEKIINGSKKYFCSIIIRKLIAYLITIRTVSPWAPTTSRRRVFIVTCRTSASGIKVSLAFVLSRRFAGVIFVCTVPIFFSPLVSV
jgi:hypothetical protein